MALVRVYCGISSAGEAGRLGEVARLTVAVVDDSGRLLEACEINDDPAGYAALTAFLAERFGGSTAITVAVDDDEHLVVSLLAASGRFIAFTDDGTADDFADRFADDDSLEEVNAAAAERRAVGLARALQAGALSAGASAPPREFAVLKPVLAAHAALAVGRHAAAVALREVLRELYPAALRAYPDPASPVALAMLDALPEPSLLTAAAGRGRDAAVSVANRLVAEGVCDNDTALEAVTALRVAISETPRRNGVGKQLNAAVADAVRASVAAVRSADNATNVLVRALTDKITPNVDPVAAPAPRRRPAPAPITTVTPTPRTVSPPPATPAPVSAAPVPVAVSAVPVSPGRPAWTHSTPPPTPPGFEPTPVTGSPIVPMTPVPMQRPAPAAPAPISAPVMPTPVAAAPVAPAPVTPVPVAEPLTPFVPTLTNAAINSQRANRGLARPPASHAAPVSASPQSASSQMDDWAMPEPAMPVSASPQLNEWAPIAHAAPVSASPQVNERAPAAHAAPVSAAPQLNDWTPVAHAAPVSAAPQVNERAPVAHAAPVSASPLVNDWAPVARATPVSAAPQVNDWTPVARATPVSASPQLANDPLPSRSDWPLNPAHEDDAPTVPKRVTPPWQADDLVLPSLRLVEPAPSSAPPASPAAPLRVVDDPLTGPSPLSPISALDDDRNTRIPKPRRTERMSAPPAEDDTDLLIFASVSSAWFAGGAEDSSEPTWNSSMDTAWRAAEDASLRPTIGGDTRAGLPQRVPAANLVPGSPLTTERPLRIVRDADEIAAHTSSYFRGWRKGTQETGGYSVGGRPGRESATGWDFSREHELRDDRGEYHHRAANYR